MTGCFATCRSSSVKCLYVSFACFPVELLGFLLLDFESSLFSVLLLCQICGLQMLSPSLWFVFLALHTVFCGTEVFYFDGIQFINLYFYGLSFKVKSLCLVLDPKDFLLVFSKNYTGLCFIYKLMVYIDYFCLFFVTCGYLLAPALFVEKAVLPPFCTFLKKQLAIIWWVCFWVLGSAPLKYASLCSPVPHNLDYDPI